MLGVAVSLGDIHRWVEEQGVVYLRAINEIPGEMRQRLDAEYYVALDPRVCFPSFPSSLTQGCPPVLRASKQGGADVSERPGSPNTGITSFNSSRTGDHVSGRFRNVVSSLEHHPTCVPIHESPWSPSYVYFSPSSKNILHEE